MVVILTHQVHYSLKSNHHDKTVTVTSLGMTLQKDSSNFQLSVEKESGIAFISFDFALRLVQTTQATLEFAHDLFRALNKSWAN